MIWPFNHLRYKYRTVYSRNPQEVKACEKDYGWKISKISFAGWTYVAHDASPAPLWRIVLEKDKRNK